MLKALVTGHAGFIGRHFVKRLQDDGYEVVGADIKDGGLDCRDAFKKDCEVFDLVIHCAAIVGGRATIEGEPLKVATDLSIDAEMFNWALRTGQKKVVYFSSSAAYPVGMQMTGEYPMSGLKESDIDLLHPEMPDETYGWAKLTGEMLAEKARKQGLEVYIFRPFSGYGEDQDFDYPFPSFIKRAKDQENPFKIWGDGKQVRDWVHVDDIVGAVMAAIEQKVYGPVNICSGVGTSFLELASLVMKHSPYPYGCDIETDPSKPTGVRYRVGDPTLLNTFYFPKVSLEEGIKMALKK